MNIPRLGDEVYEVHEGETRRMGRVSRLFYKQGGKLNSLETDGMVTFRMGERKDPIFVPFVIALVGGKWTCVAEKAKRKKATYFFRRE